MMLDFTYEIVYDQKNQCLDTVQFTWVPMVEELRSQVVFFIKAYWHNVWFWFTGKLLVFTGMCVRRAIKELTVKHTTETPAKPDTYRNGSQCKFSETKETSGANKN